MKASRLASLVTAVTLSTSALVSAPVAGAEEPVAPIAQANADRSNPDPKNPDPDMAVEPTTPWLRILEGSSQGPAAVIIAILFGIISIGFAAYKEFGDYLPKLG